MSGKIWERFYVDFFAKRLCAHRNLSQNMFFKTQIFRKTWLSKPKSFEHYRWNRKKQYLRWLWTRLWPHICFYLVFFGSDYFCWKNTWCFVRLVPLYISIIHFESTLYDEMIVSKLWYLLPYCSWLWCFFSRWWSLCYFPIPAKTRPVTCFSTEFSLSAGNRCSKLMQKHQFYPHTPWT